MAKLTLNAEIFRQIYPKEYLDRFIQKNLRPDGRHLQEFREISITTGKNFSIIRSLGI